MSELTNEQKMHITHAVGIELIDLLIKNKKAFELAQIDGETVTEIFLAGLRAGADAMARLV